MIMIYEKIYLNHRILHFISGKYNDLAELVRIKQICWKIEGKLYDAEELYNQWLLEILLNKSKHMFYKRKTKFSKPMTLKFEWSLVENDKLDYILALDEGKFESSPNIYSRIRSKITPCKIKSKIPNQETYYSKFSIQ